jgi:HPt (histidine-containing phosphotransfer) domain-containing protein
VLLEAIRDHSIVVPFPQSAENTATPKIFTHSLPKVQTRIPGYLENCRQNVIVMLDALDRLEFQTVANLGHQMSGSGGMFGFQAISDISSALEQAGLIGDADASRKWLGELSNYLNGAATISN